MSDPLAPARGILIAILVTIPFSMLVGWLIAR
jgi:hypothetical protein